jgi:hypothetical protein
MIFNILLLVVGHLDEMEEVNKVESHKWVVDHNH